MKSEAAHSATQMAHEKETKECTSAVHEKNSGGTNQRWALKFGNRDLFARFCSLLVRERVAFTHVGFQTIILPAEPERGLTEESLKLLKESEANGQIAISRATSAGKRRLVTREESQRLLQRFTREL